MEQTTAAPAAAPSGYISNPFELLKPSIDALKVNLGAILGGIGIIVLLGVLAAVTVLGTVFTAISHKGLSGFVAAGPVVFLVLLAAFIIIGPMFTLLLLASAKGEKMSLGDALKGSPRFSLRFLGLGILTGLAILGGLLLLIVPAIIFGVWFSQAAFVLVDMDLGVVESMKRSKELVSGHFWHMLGVLGFGQALNILNIVPFLGGLVAFVVGILYSAAPAVRYIQLKALKAANQPAPPVHWANWLIIVLAVLAPAIGAATAPKQTQVPPVYQLPNDTTTQ